MAVLLIDYRAGARIHQDGGTCTRRKVNSGGSAAGTFGFSSAYAPEDAPRTDTAIHSTNIT